MTSHVHVYLEALDSYGFRLIIIRTAGLDSYPEMCVPDTSCRSLNDVLGYEMCGSLQGWI